MEVTIEVFEGEPLGMEIPDNVIVTVEEAEPVVKGQTASSSYKPAIVTGGVKVMVPPFIEVGTKNCCPYRRRNLFRTREEQ